MTNLVPEDEDFILLFGDIDDEKVQPVIEWIINGDTNSPTLNLIISSDGGDICSAFALIDCIRTSKMQVNTIAMGKIASAALMIFMAGTKGHRIITKNTSILTHQFYTANEGKHHELHATIKEYELTNNRMIDFYSERTGLTKQKVKKYLLPDSDVWLSVDEAKEFGICDIIQ